MKLFQSFTPGRLVAVITGIVFLAFFSVEYLTPFHSDDYSYGQMGLEWAKHYRHYMGWSGRLLADYASSLILLSKSHAVVSVILGAIAAGTCYLIAALPGRLFGTAFSPFKFVVIVGLYWVCNPNLGQTTFWVVGACNYLVTNFFIVLFLYLYLTYKASAGWGIRTVLFVSALLAGCTNENTSLAIIYTFIAMCLVMKFFKIEFDLKSACFYGVGLVIGMLVLLLAPGNYVRANHPAFRWFKTKTVKDKILMQLGRGNYLKEFWPAYLLVVWGAVQQFFRRRTGADQQRLVWTLLFLSSSFAAFAVMAGSPAMPPRAYSGVFFFLLIAVSFALDGGAFKGLSGKLLSLPCLAVIGVGIWAWLLVFISYGITKDQEAIRIEQINYQKLENGPSAQPTIPDWYFVRLRKKSDMFDMYHSGAMAGWFGVSKVNLVRGMDYDYSVMKTGEVVTVLNRAGLAEAKIFVRPYSWKTNQNGTVVLETTTDIRDKKLAVAYYEDRSRNRQEIRLSNKVLCIKGKYYTGATVRKLPNVKNVEVVVR